MPSVENVAPRTRAEAQRRADRIRAFQRELHQAVRDGGLQLSPDQEAGLAAYHQDALASLARRFDIDISSQQRQVSRGMQAAGVLGGLALGASVFLFVLRVWGLLSTGAQVALLVLGSVLSLLLLEAVSRSERLKFLTGIAALVAFACFVLNVEGLARVFALEAKPEGLLAYAAFALALAYAHQHRLLLVVGATSAIGYVAASLVRLGGAWWTSAFLRPEGFIVGGALVAAAGLLPHRQRDEFPPYLRGIGVLFALAGLLAVGRVGDLSWFDAPPQATQATYQVLLFVVSVAAIVIGIKRGWNEVGLLGALFFLVGLYLKFVDWWWDWMPGYLFFLIVGVSALLLLGLFQRVRARLVS